MNSTTPDRQSLALKRAPIGGIGISLVGAAIAAALSGCVVQPQPLTRAEQTAQIDQDRATMFGNQEPVTKPITVSEAMARAIRYNLDNRLKLMEEALSQRQLTLANWSMLPQLTAAAGYVARDTELASSSRDVATGAQSLVPSTSQDKSRRIADLGFTWNVLDFGVSYFQAKERADRTLIMKERRRKVVHSLMQQVREAYWFALGAQSLEGKIEPLLKDVEQALASSQQIEQERLSSPVDALNYRRQLLSTLRQLEAARAELSQAKPRLAALINIEPGKDFQLAAPGTLAEPQLDLALPAMEEAALLRRPELIEARYSERIGVLETKIAMARLLPGVELGLSSHYDSNSFLVENAWNEAGLLVSWNLFNVLSHGKQKATAQAMLEVARAQRLALNMAVLSQVHVSYRDLQARKRQYELSTSVADVDRSLLTHAQNAARTDAQGRLASINTGVQSMFSELRVYQDYGALQNAYGLVLATLGVDPLPDTVGAVDIASLAQSIDAVERRGPAL